MRFLAVIVAALVPSVGLTGAPPGSLPRPSFTVPDAALDLAAAGSRVAIASGCDVHVLTLGGSARPVRLKPFGDCRDDPFDSAVDALYLGRATLVAQVILAPSPHGEEYSLWRGPLPSGPLSALGDSWGWTDSDVPSGYGCAWSVASGGGVVAAVQGPNVLGTDGQPQCIGGTSSRIVLLGAARAQLTVPGSWSLLAAGADRLALARLGPDGTPMGELEVADLNGRRLAT